MSLQVWLPLNGDLHNQGLAKINLTNTVTFTTSGKIGQSCLNSELGWFSVPEMIGKKQMSFAYWVKLNAGTTTDWLDPFSWTTSNGTSSYRSRQEFYYYNKNGNTDNEMTTGVWYYNSSNSGMAQRKVGQWYHYSFSIDYETGISQFFVDGQLWKTTTNVDKNYYISGSFLLRESSLNCSINDFRLYDHCLNVKEVEEISKGLVLHYKLNDTYIENTTNLVTTEDGLGNTCYNGATSKYNYGTNTDMYKTVGIFEGRFCTKVYMGTAGKSAYPYVYFDSFNAKGTEIQTISFDYFPTIQDTLIAYSYNGTYNFNYTSNYSNKGSNTNVSQIIIPVNINQWNHITITAQKYDTTNTSRGIGYIRIGSTSHISTTTNYWLFANVQVENKDHATGYAGIAGARNDYIIYDSSGYSNNGIIINSLEIVTPSPCYDYAINFNGSSAIKVIDNNWMAQGASDLTVNIWVYMDNWANWNGNRLYSCTEGGGFNIENTVANSLTFPVCVYTNAAQTTTGYIPETSRVSILKTDLTSGWHMLTYIYTKTECRCYLDGILYQKKSYTSYGVYFNIVNSNLFLGCEANGISAGGPYFTGRESDFKIYYTALTEAQIKELYMTSRKIVGTDTVPRDLE